MTNQKYQIGDKVLVEAEFCGAEELDGNQIIVIPSGLVSYAPVTSVSPEFIRPYTPKPEFKYGEKVEVKNFEDKTWIEAAMFFCELPNGKGVKKSFVVLTGELEECIYKSNHQTIIVSLWDECRKLQPKKELIEINGKKYDAEKVKERLAGLKAEE